MAETISYDYTSPVKSPFLRLKSKGDSCKIRIVSDPVKFGNIYHDPKTDLDKKQEKYAWLVLDRNIAPDDDFPIKIFTGGSQIWTKIKTYVKDEDWGDPMTYDLTITRTENSPSDYYSVTPSPNNKGDLTTEEMGIVMGCDIDLVDTITKLNAPKA